MALTERAPERLGRYEILGRIARGGMGTIYLARLTGSEGFEKRFAIKTLHPHLSEDAHFRSMFLDEMRLASRIDHPAVCSVVDSGIESGSLFMVMEHCDGLTLSELRVRHSRRLPYAFHARVIADAARGLHAAHELLGADGAPLGVVHRDVSPQNIMVLRRGGVKVLDFGVARARDRVSSTRTGETKGKVAYMAPEQLRVDAIDARADVWALCVVLWEACLDRNPFEGARPALTITNILGMPLPDPTESSTDLPPHLCRILRQGLVRDPARRIASAASLADRLEEYLYSLGTPFGMREVAEHVAHAFTAPGAGETTDVEVHAMDAEKTAGTSAVRRLSHGTGRITAPVTAPAVAPVTGSSRRRVRAGAAWLGAIGTTLAAAAAIVWTLATPDPVFDVREKRAGDLGKPATRADPTPEPAAVAPVPPLVVDAAAEAEPVAVQPIAAPPSDSEPAPGGERAAPGFLSVYAVPNAEVWLAGQHLGETPLRRPVQAGRHVVTLKYPDGTAERHRVRVQPGRTARISSAHDP